MEVDKAYVTMHLNLQKLRQVQCIIHIYIYVKSNNVKTINSILVNSNHMITKVYIYACKLKTMHKYTLDRGCS